MKIGRTSDESQLDIDDEDCINTGGDPDKKIEAIRLVVERKAFKVVDGILVDLFSASVIIQVFDALSAENKRKYKKLSLPRMQSVAFDLVEKSKQ